jgi:murein DD-endopeptidase MepM/ murein hydrolase activator NlpD
MGSTTTLLTAAGLAAGAALAAGAPAWRWPVPLDPAVSSNFCQYRDGRFHAGIDVRTFGREGVPCLAVADGWISRVRCSSRGYGKALHLTLDSGDQVVYAHLCEFAPELEDTLYAAQMHDTSYTVDLRMPPERFRVAAGDTIAYSGSTGAVAPHLHLEVRDAEDRPVDPFGHGLGVSDRLRPAIGRLVFVPLGPSGRVNGKGIPLGMSPRRVSDGRMVIPDTLVLRAPVGVAASATDRVNAVSGRLAPRALEAWAADSLVARLALERFSFERSTEVDRVYHAGALRARGAAVFQLYARGARLEHAWWRDGGALPPAGTGVVEGRVRVTDAAGNTSEVVFYYREDADAAARAGEPARARADFAVELEGAFFHDGFAVLPASAAARAATESGRGAAPSVTLEARHLGAATRPLALYADRDTAEVWVAGVVAGEARTLTFPAHGLTLDLPAGATGADAVVYARGANATAARAEGLSRRTRAVRVGPVGWVLAKDMTVSMQVASPTDQDALYRYDDFRRSWSCLPSQRDSSGVVRARASRPGVFAVFRDEVPPRVGRPATARSYSWATGEAVPEIQVAVDDVGSGPDESSAEVRVGGVRRVFRWDFAAKKIIVPLRGEPIIGSQSVRVVVFDRVGNRTAVDATVDITAR